VMSKPLDHQKVPKLVHPDNPRAQQVLSEHMQQRLQCIWATPCGRGCNIGANFQSTTVFLPPAVATGNLTIITDAMAREVTVDKRGRATGVHYIDKKTRSDRHVAGRVVILAAGAGESARILFNSKSNLFPHGLANGSGMVGKWLMDTVGAYVGAQIPAFENCPPVNDDGGSAMHMYSPWWLYKEQLKGKLNFARGYHIEPSGGRMMPGSSSVAAIAKMAGNSYGQKLKEDARRYYGSFINLAGRGEMIPNKDSYCELDPEVVDDWGIPVLRFHWKWSEHELNQAAHMHQTFADMVSAMGGKVTTPVHAKDGAKAIQAPGEIIHEVGSVRMGSDPRTSVLNGYCQAHEVKNLYVTDGAALASNADKNPTLSIMALAWRAADHLMGEMKRRAL
jgi:choline dehydrogenase-like flavoprotein